MYSVIMTVLLSVMIHNFLTHCEKWTVVDESGRSTFSGWICIRYKVSCVFLMVVVYLLTHVEIGRNDNQEHTPYFIFWTNLLKRYFVFVKIFGIMIFSSYNLFDKSSYWSKNPFMYGYFSNSAGCAARWYVDPFFLKICKISGAFFQ